MIFVTDEQRQILEADGAPMSLIDGETGKCYMVMPVNFSSVDTTFIRARMPGFGAVADAEIPSDAAELLAMLVKKMLEEE